MQVIITMKVVEVVLQDILHHIVVVVRAQRLQHVALVVDICIHVIDVLVLDLMNSGQNNAMGRCMSVVTIVVVAGGN